MQQVIRELTEKEVKLYKEVCAEVTALDTMVEQFLHYYQKMMVETNNKRGKLFESYYFCDSTTVE